MKRKIHRNRKSFARWAMPNQRDQTLTADLLDVRRAKAMIAKRNYHPIGRNGYHTPQPPAQNRLTPGFKPKQRLVPRNFCRSKYGVAGHSKGRIYAGESVRDSHIEWQQNMESVN